MSRFLFVVPPLTGHVNPTVSVARALQARGHDVAWVAHPGKVRPLLPAGARLFALPEVVEPELVTEVRAKANATRGAAALKFLWEEFLIPLARSMRPGIDAAVAEFAPDVLCVDQQAVAGGIVARMRGLRWATLATTSAGVTDPLASLPQVKRWLRELIAGLEREAGLPSAEAGELSPHAVIAFTTPALVPGEFPAHYHFVGPSISDRPEATEFPMAQLRRPCVLVSMGTVNAEASGRFYATTLAALRDQAYQVILVAPHELEAPKNFIVRSYVPQLALLPHVDAVVCHGGHNTTCEALAHGLPLVIAPIKDDQPIVADQVVAAGAGVRVKFGRVQPPALLDAVTRVMTDAGFRAAAHRIRDSFVAAGGAEAAATRIRGARMSYLMIALVLVFVMDAIRLRRHVGALHVLEPSDATPGHQVIAAPGVTVDDATTRAASAYARERGIDVLDLVPRDLPAIRAMSVAQLVDPPSYRRDRLGPGRTAGHAVMISESVAQRAQAAAPADVVEFVRLATRLKYYGPADVAIAPAEHARPVDLSRRFEILRTLLGPPATVAVGAAVVLWLLIGIGIWQRPIYGLAALVAWQLQPLIVLGFTSFRSPDLVPVTLFRLPIELWIFLRTVIGRHIPVEAGERRAGYERVIAGGHRAVLRATPRYVPDLRRARPRRAPAQSRSAAAQAGCVHARALPRLRSRVPESAAVDRRPRFLLQGFLRRARRIRYGVHLRIRRRALSRPRADGARCVTRAEAVARRGRRPRPLLRRRPRPVARHALRRPRSQRVDR